jgi:hypothetical protein
MSAVKREGATIIMLKSLMLAVACAHINPPGLQPNPPVVEATVPEILKQAYAMKPGSQKEIIIDHGDGLCSKVMIEPSTDEALNAFIDPEAAKHFAVPLLRPR